MGKKHGEEKPCGNSDVEPAAEDERSSEECRELGDLELRNRELEEAAARWEDEKKGYEDRFLRERADFENFKKRAQRERAEAVRYGNEAFVRDILPVLDNLERAVEHAGSGGNGQSLLDGVNLVLSGLLDVLGRHGVSRVAALGERFDPSRHEAMEQVESAEDEPNTVVREHQKGYVLHDRLIRPALVGVSRPAAASDKAGDGEGDRE